MQICHLSPAAATAALWAGLGTKIPPWTDQAGFWAGELQMGPVKSLSIPSASPGEQELEQAVFIPAFINPIEENLHILCGTGYQG